MPPAPADNPPITPYLTHSLTHHGQVTLVPADNNGRRRKAREHAASPRGAPNRLSVFQASSPTRSTTAGGLLSRIRRGSRHEESLDDIPDYPPPSFQEAMATPSVSAASTTTLGRSQPDESDSESDDDLSLDVVERASTRGRGVLDSDPDDTGYAQSTNQPRPQKRHMSLSPLRTLFPSRNNSNGSSHRESAYTLNTIGSPQSLAFPRNSPHSRSTTSLRGSGEPSPPASPSIRSENPLGSRRFFSHKGKGREGREALSSWEIVESQWPPMPVVSIAPERGVVPERAPQTPATPSPTVSLPFQRAFPREKAVPIVSSPFRDRERERERNQQQPPAPVPQNNHEPPPIVTVRSRMTPPSSASPATPPDASPVRTKKPPPPPPPPKRKAPLPPTSSPLRDSVAPDVDLDRAMRTPLPLTPVTASPPFSLPFSRPASPLGREITPNKVDEPPSSSVDSEGHYHHYPGRPLPRRPRVIVDSTYAPHPAFPSVEIPLRPPHVPEGMLIDLEGDELATPVAPLVDLDETPTVANGSHSLVDELLAEFEETPTATSSPITQLSESLHVLSPAPTPAEDTQSQSESNRQSTASSIIEIASSSTSSNTNDEGYLEITDLDVLLARIEDEQMQRDGANYEAMLMMADFIGPARAPRPTVTNDSSLLLSGQIDVARRRVLKDGRVKLKLQLVVGATPNATASHVQKGKGRTITVDRCGICLSQFRGAQAARASERCGHVYHSRCLGRWIVKSRTCPLCRIAVREA
ncbi:RING-type domain-containing protein [Mycena chlorophos]|uniref:RING-type domain-containing protein n=1 Tax=Mycena chlorophos TaxID=658473 RepID=A0A8H6TKJ2_MYCCL|nr:RING-type domain-containing protein [Mycena chlorophos]